MYHKLNNKNKSQRSKSQTCHDRFSFNYLSDNQKPQLKSKQYLQTQSRRCQCCSNKLKYPDYLGQLRKQRLQKMNKKHILSHEQQFLDQPLPMIQNKQINQQISQFNPVSKHFISKLSNIISQYQQTPKKQFICQFHSNIIKSNSSKKFNTINSVNKQNILQDKYLMENNYKEGFYFYIEVFNEETGDCYCRKFTAPEYGVKAIACIQEILMKQQ